MNPLEQNINFNAVSRIEYLRSFTGDGAPRWALLSATAFTRALERNIPLLCRITGPIQVLDIPNPFHLGPYNSVFVIGDSGLRPRTPNDTPSEVFNNIQKRTQSLFSLGSLNYKGAGSAVLPQYLCSPSVIRRPSERRSITAANTAATTAIATGGY